MTVRLGEWFRNKAYWSLDVITGARVPQRLIGAIPGGAPVYRHQFVQVGQGNYRVNLILSEKAPFDEDLARLKLLHTLGEDATIEFSYVSDIPSLPSGKRPVIVNRCYGNLSAP